MHLKAESRPKNLALKLKLWVYELVRLWLKDGCTGLHQTQRFRSREHELSRNTRLRGNDADADSEHRTKLRIAC